MMTWCLEAAAGTMPSVSDCAGRFLFLMKCLVVFDLTLFDGAIVLMLCSGSAAGLVWTAVGGQVQYVECCCTSTGQPHTPGKLVLTGQVGEVLQESAHLALSWIRSHTHQLAAAAAEATAASQAQHADGSKTAHPVQQAAEARPVNRMLQEGTVQLGMHGHGLDHAAARALMPGSAQSAARQQQAPVRSSCHLSHSAEASRD